MDLTRAVANRLSTSTKHAESLTTLVALGKRPVTGRTSDAEGVAKVGEAVSQEQVEQKTGAHGWMVAIGAGCLIAAITVGVLGRISGSTVEKAGTTTTTRSWPSETLITSLLAIGAVLIIVGFLWARITSIKVAGAEIGLSDGEKSKVADTLTEKVKGAKPEEAAQAALSVMTALTEEKAAGAAITDDRIATVVDQHTKDLA